MTRTEFANIDLDRLVRLVLEDLNPSSVAKTESVCSRSVVPAISADLPQVSEQTAIPEIRVFDKVVTLDVIKRNNRPDIKRWLLPMNAVVTPSAKDEFRLMNVELVFANAGRPNQSRPNQTSESKKENATGAVPEVNSENDRLIVGVHTDHLAEIGDYYWEGLHKTTSCRTVRNSCIIETINIMEEAIVHQKVVCGLLLTAYPALGVMLANHRKKIRAIAVADSLHMRNDLSLCGANLLIVDPREMGTFNLLRLTKDYVEHVVPSIPKFLAKAGLE